MNGIAVKHAYMNTGLCRTEVTLDEMSKKDKKI